MTGYTREQYISGQHALTKEEVAALLLTFDNIQDKAMISLAINTGLRREDLVQIKSADYDPKAGSITYYEHKKKKTRTLYIPSPETIQLLNMHQNTCRKSEWLFPSPRATQHFKGKHTSGRHIYDVLNEHLDIAGISRRPFHSLRATCYKLAQSYGWPPRMAAELLGDSMKVAEEHYNAPSIGDMQKAAKTMPFI
jgi:integrase